MKIHISGYEVLIDDEDYPRISALRWSLKERKLTRDGLVYFKHSYWADGKAKSVYLHRFIVRASHGSIVDHIDGNTLDNRKSNLRLVDHAGNVRNRKMDKRNTSGYRGVRLEYGKWTATIYVGGKCVRLGRFESREDAARAYNRGAVKHFGECARLNVILDAEVEARVKESTK